jgi:hypothetical protein
MATEGASGHVHSNIDDIMAIQRQVSLEPGAQYSQVDCRWQGRADCNLWENLKQDLPRQLQQIIVLNTVVCPIFKKNSVRTPYCAAVLIVSVISA